MVDLPQGTVHMNRCIQVYINWSNLFGILQGVADEDASKHVLHGCLKLSAVFHKLDGRSSPLLPNLSMQLRR